MIRILTVILFVIVLTACQPPDLNGHWHLDGGAITNEPLLVEIINDTTVLVDHRPPLTEGTIGYHEPYAQTLQTPMECGIGNWRYKIITTKTLEVYDANDDRLLGYMRRFDNCNKLKDIFIHSKVNLDLPEAGEKCIKLSPRELSMPICVGRPKAQYISCYSRYATILGDKFGTIDDLPIYTEYSKNGKTGYFLPGLHPTLFVDKAVPDSMVNEVIDYYHGTGEPVYLARQRPGGTQICFEPLPVR